MYVLSLGEAERGGRHKGKTSKISLRFRDVNMTVRYAEVRFVSFCSHAPSSAFCPLKFQLSSEMDVKWQTRNDFLISVRGSGVTKAYLTYVIWK